MKLYGNSKKKRAKSAVNKDAPKQETVKQENIKKETASKPAAASESGKGGLISMLARRRIEKAKAALDTEEHRRRTPEERKRIEEDVERYQKRKVVTRLVVILVILLLVVAAVVFYKMTVVPPDISKPNNEQGNNVNDGPNHSGSDANVEKSPTPSKTPIEGLRQEGMYTFLVIGNDQGNGNTDTMIVGRLDTVNHKLNMISIPRDTLVNVEWPVKKVNTIQAFNGNGVEGLVDGLSDILGFEVDSYISVNLAGFKALVETIGGVYFDVPQDMKYKDPTQNLVIDVSAGYQLLTPEKAEGVVRYRSGYAAGDIKRIEVQQAFLMALAKQCLSMKNLATNITDYAEIFKTYVTTDLTVGNLVWYGQELLKLTPDSISFSTLPANYNDSVKGLSYCSIYLDLWTAMINSSLNPYIAPIKAENLNILTRDDNGKLYATTGVIAGGMDSFYDNTIHTVKPEPDDEEGNNGEDNPPVTTDEPETTTEPTTEPTADPSPETSTAPTQSPDTEPSSEPAPEDTQSPWDEDANGSPEPDSESGSDSDPEQSEGLNSGSPSNLW